MFPLVSVDSQTVSFLSQTATHVVCSYKSQTYVEYNIIGVEIYYSQFAKDQGFI